MTEPDHTDQKRTWRDWVADLLSAEPTDRSELLEMFPEPKHCTDDYHVVDDCTSGDQVLCNCGEATFTNCDDPNCPC